MAGVPTVFLSCHIRRIRHQDGPAADRRCRCQAAHSGRERERESASWYHKPAVLPKAKGVSWRQFDAVAHSKVCSDICVRQHVEGKVRFRYGCGGYPTRQPARKTHGGGGMPSCFCGSALDAMCRCIIRATGIGGWVHPLHQTWSLSAEKGKGACGKTMRRSPARNVSVSSRAPAAYASCPSNPFSC